MEISSAYQAQGLGDLEAANSMDLSAKSASNGDASKKGDTVEISSDARELFSQMIHKYDASTTATQEAAQGMTGQPSGNGGGMSAAGNGGSGGSSSSTSSTSAASLRSQIQSLKSQLASLTSSMNGTDAGSAGQASGLNAQIAALEAQLQEAESAG